jgi:outer membrane protein assembly factor BamB
MRSLFNRRFLGLAACAVVATVVMPSIGARLHGAGPATYGATIRRMTATNQATSGRPRPEPSQDPSWGTPTGVNYPQLGGNPGNDDYSSLQQIDTTNVQQLGGAWETDLEVGSTLDPQEGTPVVSNGRMFVPTSQRDLYALNAATGTVDWEYRSGFPSSVPSSLRGATVGNGMVFSSMGAEHVVALDQSTGQVDWTVQLGDGLDGLPAAMVFYDNMLFIGTSNSGTKGGREQVFALDAANGKVLWTFYSTPGTGQPNNDTWEGN